MTSQCYIFFVLHHWWNEGTLG